MWSTAAEQNSQLSSRSAGIWRHSLQRVDCRIGQKHRSFLQGQHWLEYWQDSGYRQGGCSRISIQSQTQKRIPWSRVVNFDETCVQLFFANQKDDINSKEHMFQHAWSRLFVAGDEPPNVLLRAHELNDTVPTTTVWYRTRATP